MENDMKKEKTLLLSFVWGVRLKLFSEGNKLWAEGDKLWAKGDKLHPEDNQAYPKSFQLCSEGCKLREEGNKLFSEGNKLWAEAVLESHGNVKMKWAYVMEKKGYSCTLETGEVFEP